MKKILFLILLNVIFMTPKALTYGNCSASDVSRMRKIVSNINISYDYVMFEGEPVFSVTINNLTNDIYFYDMSTKQKYYYWQTNAGEITIYNYKISSGTYRFYSNDSRCPNINLGSKYYSFPDYNKYYSDPLCQDASDLNLCQKWVDVNYTRMEFESAVEEYKQSKIQQEEEQLQEDKEKSFSDYFIELYIKYYYYFYGALIVVCLTIMIITDRKNRFKL